MRHGQLALPKNEDVLFRTALVPDHHSVLDMFIKPSCGCGAASESPSDARCSRGSHGSRQRGAGEKPRRAGAPSAAPQVPAGPGAVSVTRTGVSRGGLGPQPQLCVQHALGGYGAGRPQPGCSRVDRGVPCCPGTVRPPDQTAVLERMSQGQQDGHPGGGGHRLAPPLWFLQEGASQAGGEGLGLAGRGQGARSRPSCRDWVWVTSGPQSETQSKGDRWTLQRLVCTWEACSQVGKGFLPQVFTWLLSCPQVSCLLSKLGYGHRYRIVSTFFPLKYVPA